MPVDRHTSMAVPVSVKWDEDEMNWIAKAPSLEISIRAESLEEATDEIEDLIREAMEVGFGVKNPEIRTQIDTVKATVTVGVFRRVDRNLFEFAAGEVEGKAKLEGRDVKVFSLNPAGGDAE